MNQRCRFCALSVGLLVFSLVGCGSSEPRKNAVSGTVQYQGKTIPQGSITFLDDKGGVVGGAPIKDGAYEIPAAAGLLAGKYKVSINYPDPKTMPPPPGPEDEELPGDSTAQMRIKDFLPAKYNSDTELTVDIEDKTNVKDFNLD